MPRFLNLFLLSCCCTVLAGCATMVTPRNPANSQYQPMQQIENHEDIAQTNASPALPHSLNGLAQLTDFADDPCRNSLTPQAVRGLTQVSPQYFANQPPLLGPGDRITLTVSGDPDRLSRSYMIGPDGQLRIEGAVAVHAAGRSREQVENSLRAQMVAHGLLRNIAGNVRLSIEESSGVQVSVSGAVFEPGILRVGERAAAARATNLTNPASGDFNAGRSLAIALRAAGGIRPDAQAQNIYLVRSDSYAVIDVEPAFTGGIPADPQLAAGDRIIVPSTGCFEARYVRPSSVTMPGIRVYLSNLSRPATGNASAGIGEDSTNFPYGVRMLDGLVSANCVGGSAMNARRRVVLISHNPISGRTVVIQRQVEDLVRRADRDQMNPYLMPGDAIACYDSALMSFTDVIGVVSKVMGPIALADGLSQ